MRPHQVPSVTLRGAATLAVAGFWLVAIAAPADAGIGNPLKKAKEAAEKEAQKAVPKTETQAPAGAAEEQLVFDDVTLELTEARLTAIETAFQKAGQIAAPRPGLVEKRNKVDAEMNKIQAESGEKIAQQHQKRDDVEGCYQQEYQQVRERRTQEYAQRAMSDPKLYEKFKNIAAENNAKAAQGDSAAIAKAQAGLLEEFLPTHDDSVQIRQKCGTPPPETPEEKRLVELDKELKSLDAQIQQLDESVAKSQAKESGMNPQQWGMALERIQMFTGSSTSGGGNSGGGKKKKGDSSGASGSGSGSGSSGSGSSSASSSHKGFTEDEVKALERHREQLRKYLG
jgi:hypothetical protein